MTRRENRSHDITYNSRKAKNNPMDLDTMTSQAHVMLEMQDGMNAHVDADWKQRNREWYRAVWIECAELMDHFGGWKWWKHQECDVEQVLLEIVDIWHFGLSMELMRDENLDALADGIVTAWQSGLSDDSPIQFHTEVEHLVSVALSERRFEIASVPRLLSCIDRDYDALFRYYVGKNILNRFRQDNGYREGSYVKTWDGREDNEHLSDILAESEAPADYAAWVYGRLADKYASVCA